MEGLVMALINCPECSKEISDKVKACPHCGYPMEAPTEAGVKAEPIPQPLEKTSIKLENSKKKTIVIVSLAIFAVVAVIAIGFFIRQQQIKAAAITAHDEYVDELKHVQALMLVTGIKAEELANLTRQVWYNTIYEKSSAETNPYTKSGYRFNDDFNDSLRALFAAQETKDTINTINAGDSLITAAMKELQSPTEEFKDCYSTLNELYSCYSSLVKLATNPSGSLQSFTESFNKADEGFMVAYDKLSLQIPDRIMPAESPTPSAASTSTSN